MLFNKKRIKNNMLIGLLAILFLLLGCKSIDKATYSIQFDFDELLLELGEAKSINASVKDSKGNIVENVLVDYSSTDNNLLAISNEGNEFKAKGKMIGDVTINASASIKGEKISSKLNCKIVSNALEFNSDKTFLIGSDTTISNEVYSNKKSWDNILYYYSYQDVDWVEWDGNSEIDSFEVNNKSYLFLRGDGNTTFFNDGRGLHFYGENVSCKGDIRYLLNYKDIENAVIKQDCFHSMFEGSPLISLPDLPFKELTKNCYYSMFSACNSLVEIPRNYLSATTLADSCYSNMFSNCTNLKTPPALPATEVVDCCYSAMFSGCKEMTSIPYLGHIITDLNTKKVFAAMFSGCEKISLAQYEDDIHINEYKLLSEKNTTAGEENYYNTFANTSKDIKNGYCGMELKQELLNNVSLKYYCLRPDLNAPYYVSNSIIYPAEN